MKTPDTSHDSRLEREVERERGQRHKNDEERAGALADDDLRIKDARENSNSAAGKLHRVRGH